LNLKALGFIAQLATQVTSIGQALCMLQDYFANTFPVVSMHSRGARGKVIIEFKSNIKSKGLQAQVLDATLCFVYREMLLMLEQVAYVDVTLPYQEAEQHKLFFATSITYFSRHQIICNATNLSTSINQKRASQLEVLLPQFLLMLTKKKNGYKSFSMQVRNMMLNMCTPELPTLEQVASQFAMSARNFQRKLTQEGLSFRKIADDIKKELSNYLSKGNKLKTQVIAYILGYSEASAYLHPVKKWSVRA
jgi:AraC-like DNA-binding protein